MTVLAPPRKRSAREIANGDYERLKPVVMNGMRSQLGRHGPRGLHFDQLDLEAWYNAAWEALWVQLEAGKQVRNPEGFLVTVACRRAIDEARRLRGIDRQAAVDPDEHGVEPDIEDALDRRTLLRHLQEGLKERLSYREWQAATLCLILGFSRSEAGKRLGMTREQIERTMDSATVKIREFTPAIATGEWCQQHDSTMRAYAMYVLDENGERYRHARAHLAGCPGCRRFVAELRHLYPALVPHPPVIAIAAGHLAGLGGVKLSLAGVLRRGASAVRANAPSWKGGASLGAGTGASAGAATGAGGGAGSALIGGKLLAVCATLCLASGAAIVGSTGTMHKRDAPKSSSQLRRHTARTSTPDATPSIATSGAPQAAPPAGLTRTSAFRPAQDTGSSRPSAAHGARSAAKPVANNSAQNTQEFGFEGASGGHQSATASTTASAPKASIATRSAPPKQESTQPSSGSAATSTRPASTSPHYAQSSASAEFGYEGR
jgi:RNA polymerase sigma factor (sigma-70 family)